MARIPGEESWTAPGVARKKIDALLLRVGVPEHEYRFVIRQLGAVITILENNVAVARENAAAAQTKAMARAIPPGSASGGS